MATNDNNVTPTALQPAKMEVTRPKLIIIGCFVLLGIVVLLEIYAPRTKPIPASSTVQEVQVAPAEEPPAATTQADREE